MNDFLFLSNLLLWSAVLFLMATFVATVKRFKTQLKEYSNKLTVEQDKRRDLSRKLNECHQNMFSLNLKYVGLSNGHTTIRRNIQSLRKDVLSSGMFVTNKEKDERPF